MYNAHNEFEYNEVFSNTVIRYFAFSAKCRIQIVHVHFQESAASSTVGLSLLRTAMMMLELDFISSFNDPYTDNDPKTLYFGGTVIFLLVCFVLLMPILLMNLLVGFDAL